MVQGAKETPQVENVEVGVDEIIDNVIVKKEYNLMDD